jgi:uroporphyrinogen decarboxylase
MNKLNKRERLETTLSGEAADRVPVAVWRPFPGDDQRSADLAQCIIDYQLQFDWDFIQIVPADNALVIDYGVQDEWQGAADGSRVVLRSPIRRSLDWTELRTLDPLRGELAKQLECVRLVQRRFAGEVPILFTLHSPMAQARRLVGDAAFVRYLRQRSDRVRTGLNILLESTLRLIEQLAALEISGIVYVIEHADHDRVSEAEYNFYGFPYDQRILDSLPRHWWLNLVELNGTAPITRFLAEFPVQAVRLSDTSQSMVDLRSLFEGTWAGGLHVEEDLRQGTPATIRGKAREIMLHVPRRYMLTSGGNALVTTPLSNLRAVRSSVEGGGGGM